LVLYEHYKGIVLRNQERSNLVRCAHNRAARGDPPLLNENCGGKRGDNTRGNCFDSFRELNRPLLDYENYLSTIDNDIPEIDNDIPEIDNNFLAIDRYTSLIKNDLSTASKNLTTGLGKQ
jgi:hypothetical protein